MKVNNSTIKNLANVSTDNVRETKNKGLTPSNGFDSKLITADPLGSSAKVELSPRAKDMKRIKELALKAPDVDEAKISKFQKLIDSGKYKVDSAKVADKLVDDQLLNASMEDEG